MAEIDVCSHGRPDHQELIGRLLEALGKPWVARPETPQAVFEECLAEIEAQRAALVLLGRVHMPAERHWGYFESDGALPVDLSPAVREVFDDLKATVLGLEAPDA